MSTVAQIAANRANARKSTGPRTLAGKTASSANALKHGLDAESIVIPGEDPAEYECVVAEYQRDLQPQSTLEQFQVDTIVNADWERRRARRIQAKLYRALLAEGADPTDLDVNVLRDSPNGKLLLKAWARIASLERAYNRALAELRRLRLEREQAAADEVEEAVELPAGLPDVFAETRDQLFPRNEPNPALRL